MSSARSAQIQEKQYETALKPMSNKLPAMLSVLEKSFLPAELKEQYRGLILSRAKMLDIIP